MDGLSLFIGALVGFLMGWFLLSILIANRVQEHNLKIAEWLANQKKLLYLQKADVIRKYLATHPEK